MSYLLRKIFVCSQIYIPKLSLKKLQEKDYSFKRGSNPDNAQVHSRAS